MKLLVFQHIDCEHPGSLRNYLRQDGIIWTTVNLDQGEDIPLLEDYDALWVMGGPMDVWDVRQYPWLVAEKRAICYWVNELQRPYLGLCLGHQLLGDALGGTCGPLRSPEIGIMDIHLTKEGRIDPVFGSLPRTQKCLQWHSVEVAEAPQNSVILASSPACDIQAMRVGNNAWSAQYHVELEPDTITNWNAIPAYAKTLKSSLGPSGFDDMNKAAKQHMANFSKNSQELYENFMIASGFR